MMDGRGVFIYSDGKTRYEGEFSKDQKSGKGVETFENGDRYEGEFKADKREGKGTFKFAESGCEYSGEWKAGLMHGKGKKYHPTKKITYYEGEWHKDMKHGKGIEQFENGDVYEGLF